MQGKFSLKYFLLGAGKEDWFKSWGMGWRLFVTLLPFIIVGLILWSAFFKKTTTVNVGKGGKAYIGQTKRFFIPFIEGGVEQKKSNSLATYLRGGLRFEF